MATLQHDVPPPRLTADDLDALLREVAERSRELAVAPAVGQELRLFLRTLPARLHADSRPGAFSGDPYLSEQVFAGVALAAAALLDDEPASARRDVRIGLEQIRQALRDAVEARPSNDDARPEAIVAWLEAVTGAPQTRLAAIVGTAPRTWQRWKAGDQIPDEVAALRLRRLASVVAQLRHTLTSPGVLAWLDRPHPSLKAGQATPSELLDDAEGYRAVLHLAARLRSMTAT